MTKYVVLAGETDAYDEIAYFTHAEGPGAAAHNYFILCGEEPPINVIYEIKRTEDNREYMASVKSGFAIIRYFPCLDGVGAPIICPYCKAYMTETDKGTVCKFCGYAY